MQPAGPEAKAVTVEKDAKDAPRQVTLMRWSAAAAAEAAEAAVLLLLQSVRAEPAARAAVQAVS